ncbi:hypothetical protein LTR97_007715 [Elasticomyces elasticus]|uniref:Heterokaryon incompatibility domain-containing protein n=1 Tax=Elasticomyces elasticus TaxID=574655 RepID=A0AAN7W5E1_9PEZI|nr:hypothetical protein LTR97_007715 [Elasticomyces elasticus]
MTAENNTEMEHYTYANLCCDVGFINLQDGHPSYDAISYTWGTPDSSEPLHVGDTTLWITTSLASALRRLRSQTTVRVLWADATCINQRDDDEKGVQVNMMARIYRSARHVCIHLGDTPSDCELGLEFLKKLGRRVPSMTQEEEYLQFDHERHDDLIQEVLLEDDVDGEGALRQLLSLPWFTRTWTFQEAACQARVRPALIFYGPVVMLWSHLYYSIVPLLRSTIIQNANVRRALEHLELIDHVSQTLTSATSVSGARCPTILDLLNDSHACQCSDARDKIYALLSCAADIEGSFTHTGTLDHGIAIEANYKVPAERVFEQLAVALLSYYKSLDILNCAGAFSLDVNKNPKTPSWIPQWTARRAYRPFLNIARFRAGLPRTDDPDSEAPRLDYHALHCTSIMIGTIEANQSPVGQNLELVRVREYLRIWLSFLKAQGVALGEDSDTGLQALWEFAVTLTAAGTFTAVSRFLQNIRATSVDEEQSLEDGANELRQCYPEALVEILLGDDEQDFLKKRMSHEFASVLCRTMAGRCLFYMGSGGFGIGPSGARCDDQVVVLVGGRTPFVLRPEEGHNDTYRLVGDAFVHDLMRGEALTQRSQELRRIRII